MDFLDFLDAEREGNMNNQQKRQIKQLDDHSILVAELTKELACLVLLPIKIDNKKEVAEKLSDCIGEAIYKFLIEDILNNTAT